MSKELAKNCRIDLDTFSTGATAAAAGNYWDMQKYDRIDFIIGGLAKLDSSGAAGGTDYQKFTIAAYQATSATGGGASAISSATCVMGKDSDSGVSTSYKCREGFIFFSTLTSGSTHQITVGTANYTLATATAAANEAAFASAADATSIVQSFVTMFNSTANNTSTAITANWKAATLAAGVPWCRIIPKDPESTHILHLGCEGSSFIGVGGAFSGHIGIDRQFLTKRYVGLRVNSTENANAYCVHVLRQAINQPATSPGLNSKDLNSATTH